MNAKSFYDKLWARQVDARTKERKAKTKARSKKVDIEKYDVEDPGYIAGEQAAVVTELRDRDVYF
jgi:hypothetical protein